MTPWPADLQITDPPLFDAGVVELAWSVLMLSMDEEPPPWEDEALVTRTARMIGRAPADAAGLLEEWCRRDAPLTGLRTLYPARTPPRLYEAEVHLFLQGALRSDDEGRQLAWQMLFRAGMSAVEAWSAQKGWSLADGVLPTGQWFAEADLHAAAPDDNSAPVYRCSNGVTIPWGELMEVLELASRSRIKAVKRVRTLGGSSLRESLNIVNALQSGELTPHGPPVDLARLTAPRASGRSRDRTKLDACIDSLLLDRPLHWVLLAMTEIHEDPAATTMAVGTTEHGTIKLFFNPRFVRRISSEQCKGVLLHELNHVLLGHLRPPEDTDHPAAWRYACECSANEFIPYPLPGRPITIQSMDLPPMESTLTRYNKLKGRKGLLSHPCGGIIAGRLSADAVSIRQATSRRPPLPLHTLMEAAELVGDEIDRDTVEALKGCGTAAGSAMLLHLEPEGLGSLRWDVLLQKKARSLLRRVATRRFPSRRFPGQIGIIPGRRRRRDRPAVLAAVDTSGSMTPDELTEIIAELRGLTRQNLKVALVQCDATIHEARWLDATFKTMAVKGRGGTDLRPPFAPDVLERFSPGLIVYFTDGHGPAPASPPPGVSVLWVLTGANPAIPARYGQVVCMRERASRSRVSPPSS